jgi:hypothetical protein
MREIIIQAWCDLVYQHEQLVSANKIPVALEFNGQKVTLDLCDECTKAIAESLKPLLDKGKPVRKKGNPGIKGNNLNARTDRAGMRAFAASHGFKVPKNSGGYSYSNALREAYAAYKAGSRELPSASPNELL